MLHAGEVEYLALGTGISVRPIVVFEMVLVVGLPECFLLGFRYYHLLLSLGAGAEIGPRVISSIGQCHHGWYSRIVLGLFHHGYQLPMVIWVVDHLGRRDQQPSHPGVARVQR